MTQEAFFLESGNTQLYGVLFSPVSPSPGKVFLFCHPMFEEKKASHRVLVELARKLAENNCASLMLDFSACGDSEGNIHDFTPSKWDADINTGINYLKERFDNPAITLLGIRFGATLAVQCAEKEDCIKDLILIDPVIKGQTYIDEILQQKYIREMMTFGESKSDTNAMFAELEKTGQLDIDGLMVPSDFFNSLKTIDLNKSELSKVKKILLIQQSPKETLLPIYEELKKNCEIRKIDLDMARLKCPSFWKAVDMAEFEMICEAILKWVDK